MLFLSGKMISTTFRVSQEIVISCSVISEQSVIFLNLVGQRLSFDIIHLILNVNNLYTIKY